MNDDQLRTISRLTGVSGVYCILVTGRVYIGHSSNIGLRLLEHVDELRLKKHHCCRLQEVYDDLGEGALRFGLLVRAGASRHLEEAKAIHRAARKYGLERLLNTYPYHLPLPACLLANEYTCLDAFDL